VQELQRAKADYALAKALTRLDRFALLVIDDNRFEEARGLRLHAQGQGRNLGAV
jgi:hypothetical protein